MLKNKNFSQAKKSFVAAATFGFLSSIYVLFSGDESAYQVAQKQPMKLAAMEGLYKGDINAPIVAFGVLNPNKTLDNNESEFLYEFSAPYILGIMATRDINNFTPGINDIIYGNEKQDIAPLKERINSGKIAISALKEFKAAKDVGDSEKMNSSKILLEKNMNNLGYGYLDDPKDAIPPVATTFYSFHLMVILGSYFIVLFLVSLFLSMGNKIEKFRKILWLCVFSTPLGWVASEAGWIVAEVGRQPWAIQDLMPVGIAATNLGGGNVALSFFVFAILFTLLLIAEIKIMTKQIKLGF